MKNTSIWCFILVSYFCSSVMFVIVAMPHHELGHFTVEEAGASFVYNNGNAVDHHPTNMPNSFDAMMESANLSSVVENNGTAINANPTMEDFAAAATSTEITSKSKPTNENEPTNFTITANDNDDGGSEGTSMTMTIEEATKTTTTTANMELMPNEISRPLSSSLPETSRVEEIAKQQQEVGNVVEDAGIMEFPMNSITPTIAAMLSMPLMAPPPPPPPVIDPISFHEGNHNDDASFTKTTSDNGVSSTSTSYLAAAPPSLPTSDASNPSVQLIPPHQFSSLSSADIPREPDQGELPESPEPHPPQHPYNLQDIPISLLSLSGNSGGSSSDMATFSSFTNPNNNMPVDFTRFRYHVVTGQLVKIGSTGPGICPQNMRFFAVPGHPKNGACDCDYYQCSRPLIYSSEMHQCYWAWSQGPCDKEEWFVFDKDLRRRGKCEKNPCPMGSSLTSNDTTTAAASSYNPSPFSSLSDYHFQSQKDQACYQAGTQGYCEDADERLLIFPGEPIPKCRKFTLCYPLTVPQELQCIYGNKYFVESGQCQ